MDGAQQVLSLSQGEEVAFGFVKLVSVVLTKTAWGKSQTPAPESFYREDDAMSTCKMSLCLCKVCINAALCVEAPGVFVCSAILSLTTLSCNKDKINIKESQQK